MRKLIRIVLTIQFALMLTHCAASTDSLYREYAACRTQTLHPKVTDAGVVMVHKNGDAVMVYKTGACPDELAKWEKSHVLREKRRREREAYQSAVDSCERGTTLVCTGRGASRISKKLLDAHVRCGCVTNYEIQKGLNRLGY